MLIKTMPLGALDFDLDLLDGEFKALVSVFGNVDADGDRVMPGAFAGSLDRWKERGDPLPIVWSHQWFDPFAHIGHAIEAKETPDGLLVHGALDLDNPTAVQVRRLLVARRVRNFSFAYDVLDERPGDDGANELWELDVHEVGPALRGSNTLTDVLAAKGEPITTTERIAGAIDTADVATLDAHAKANALRLRAATLDLPDLKAPVSPHTTATSESGWDGPANEARVRTGEEPDYYRRIYAWRDPDGDPTTKAGWRFIHHEVDGSGNPGAANLRAASSAIAILNGARGGTTIPNADRPGVWSHLARHLRDADRDVPPLR